jgi:hypothetical protein
MVTVVGDRESDIYDLFAAPRPDNVHLLVRAQHDRRLSEGGRLFEEMAKRPHVAGPSIDIPAKPGRPARSAPVFAVHVEEIDPPPNEKPIMWLLLTTHKVESLADALLIVEWYRARWTIDIDQAWRLSRFCGWGGLAADGRRRDSTPRRRGRSDGFQGRDGVGIGQNQLGAFGAAACVAAG